MRIEVLFFAGVRDAVGLSSEQLELSPTIATVQQLVVHLAAVHPQLDGRLGSVRVAVNEAFSAAGDPISDGDVIALIPPVAGG